METIERITPERVAAAYEKCGMNPAKGHFCNLAEKDCCALSAIAMSEFLVETRRLDRLNDFEEASWLFDTLGLDYAYARGFARGFDSEDDEFGFSLSRLYKLGFDDGCAAAIRMGLHEPEGEVD